MNTMANIKADTKTNTVNSHPTSLSLEQIQKDCLPLIELKLTRFFDHARTQGIQLNSEMSAYHFSTGGKRLRALIPCYLYAAFNKDPHEAIPLGCALELVHNATLVHDDLQDRDQVRRGKPTVWKKYSDVQAINCGDALFQFAFEVLWDLNVSPHSLKRILQRLTRGTLQVIEGQAQEFLMKEEEFPGLNRYLEVIRGKTAALFATSVTTTLEALDLPKEDCLLAEKAAMESGMLFQIQDDLLDVYGNKQRDRKATDIAEGKISALIACLNDIAPPAERQEVSDILLTPREQTSDDQIQKVLHLFEKYGIQQKMMERIRQIQRSVQEDQALDHLHPIRSLLTEMNHQFLEPIKHLWT